MILPCELGSGLTYYSLICILIHIAIYLKHVDFCFFLSLIYKIIILILKNLNSFSDKCKKQKLLILFRLFYFFIKI